MENFVLRECLVEVLRKRGRGGVVMGKKIKDVICQWRIFNQESIRKSTKHF
jgi:hypothetical protein